jgi:hypothetical protein
MHDGAIYDRSDGGRETGRLEVETDRLSIGGLERAHQRFAKVAYAGSPAAGARKAATTTTFAPHITTDSRWTPGRTALISRNAIAAARMPARLRFCPPFPRRSA